MVIAGFQWPDGRVRVVGELQFGLRIWVSSSSDFTPETTVSFDAGEHTYNSLVGGFVVDLAGLPPTTGGRYYVRVRLLRGDTEVGRLSQTFVGSFR